MRHFIFYIECEGGTRKVLEGGYQLQLDRGTLQKRAEVLADKHDKMVYIAETLAHVGPPPKPRTRTVLWYGDQP